MTDYIITLNGQPIKRCNKLKIKLTPDQKKEYRKMKTRKGAKGTLKVSWDIDPYKDFKKKMREAAGCQK